MYNASISVNNDEQLKVIQKFAFENGLELELYSSHYEESIRESVIYKLEVSREDILSTLDETVCSELVDDVINQVCNNGWLNENVDELITETLDDAYSKLGVVRRPDSLSKWE